MKFNPHSTLVPIIRAHDEFSPSSYLNLDDGEVYEIREDIGASTAWIRKVPLLTAGTPRCTSSDTRDGSDGASVVRSGSA